MLTTFITPKTHIEFPRIYKDFSAGNAVRATLYITGLGLYRAFINGARVGGDYLTPGFNDYDAYLRYQTYDVTDMIRENNRIEVWLGAGWYKGRIGLDCGGKTNLWGDKYLLAARLVLTGEDGSERVIEADESWMAAASPIVSGNIYDGEVRDDTREAGEAVPCVVADVHYNVVVQFSPCIRVKETRRPTLIVTPAGENVLDFGQNMAGVIRLVNRLPKGKVMRIQTGEVLQGGNFYRDNLRSAKSEFVYTSDGEVKEIEPMFTFFGFRYAKVEGVECVDPADFTALCLTSGLREVLKVETSDERINRLMQNALWGQRSNFLDVPTDCPQRDERLGWTADTQVFVNTACYQADCKDFYKKFMRDMRADQTMYLGGDIPMYSPSMRGAGGHGGAVWADAGTIIPWNVYMNYGDEALLAENYPMMRDYAEYLIGEDERLGGTHVVFDAWTFGDWLAQDGLTPQSLKGGTDDSYIQGVYYMHSVELTAKAARVLGKNDDAARYEALAGEIREALLDEYVSPAGNLTVDTQTAYVLALRYGVYRDREKLLRGFERRLQRDFYKITSGFTGAPLMLPVLFDSGMTDAAYRMLLTEEFPGWLYAVKLGATTIWERWNSLNADGTISGTGMNSFNHYAYGSVCEAIYSRIMGLKNTAPGWTRAVIHPHINGRLTHASIEYDSPAGRWAVRWKINEDGSVRMHVSVPEGAKATVILPDHAENFTQEIGAGEYDYSWQPTRDYLHPFSADSLGADVLGDERALAVVREHMPELHAALTDPMNELRAMPLRAASGMPPYLSGEKIAELDGLLRAVRM